MFWRNLRRASLAKIARIRSIDYVAQNNKKSLLSYHSHVTPLNFNQTPYSREPTGRRHRRRGMEGLDSNLGTTRRPPSSTALPARVCESRVIYGLGEPGAPVWLGLA